ncbi:DUF4389 domain-containing protein [Stutzerimonas tarimensis]|uniref:DUF4389 domain-containing protein n=1 Tax=Stutzerimonas tarimensis TaxID=1507735 RepID=A0ABV7T8V1_9GAMM
MNDLKQAPERETLILRIIWMVLFFFVWQFAEILLLLVVLLQLLMRLIRGEVHTGVQQFGDSLSQYLAQIGRFATFNTEQKPWPFSDWPAPRPAESERIVEVPGNGGVQP